MDGKKINLAVKDSNRETKEMTVYFEINLSAKNYKKAECNYCKLILPGVVKDSITVKQVLNGMIKVNPRDELYIKTEKELNLRYNFKERKHCRSKKCIDKHLDEINKIF